MNNLGKWATEVEIIPTASLFATEIYVFSRFGRNHKWIKYKRCDQANQHIEKEKMYISHVSEPFISHVRCLDINNFVK